jgi:DNA-binding NtrC family response regulator
MPPMSDVETVRQSAKRGSKAGARPPGLLVIWPLRAPLPFFPLTKPMSSIGRAEGADLHLEDDEVSRQHALVARRGDQLEIADAGSANGVIVDGHPVERAALHGGEVIRLGSTFLRYFVEAPAEAALTPSPPPLVGGPTLHPALELIDRAAQDDRALLVLGETGTGKELVARRAHEGGPRRAGPFEAVNCAAIPTELMESELFGHVKGAFTGADVARPGLFRQAEGGTLFLDEVGDLAPAAQAKLLRALETLRVRPVGASEEVRVDVRVIAATHRELAQEVEQGRFRRDLYARLARLVVRLPPLRARIEDVPRLARFFLPEDRALSPDVIELLCRARWPQNVRELSAAIDRACFAARDAAVLEPEHFADLALPSDSSGPDAPAAPSAERDALVDALAAAGGDVGAAAQRLGISRSQLYRRAQKHGVPVGDFRR